MSVKKYLPVDSALFRTMITGGAVYVDKTRFLHQLVAGHTKYYMFNRPRRFGKSTLVTTLKELFLGNQELFKDLWISTTDYAWLVRPVVHLDMSGVSCNSPQEFQLSLSRALSRIATSYGASFKEDSNPADQFIDLVVELAQRNKVVILIDEYDYPTVSNLHDPILAKANHAVLRGFYTKLKSLEEYLHFVFLTGVSKMPKDSSFSGLNNVKDISLDPQFAAMAGCTEEELHLYFTPHVEDVAVARGVPARAIFDEMRQWYNGYHFSADTSVSVYNPFSILNYLHDKVCQNYWILSGKPSFLLECLKREQYSLKELDEVFTQPAELTVFGGERLKLATLLYQTGYVTIKSADETRTYYRLDYPNNEVRQSMESSLLAYFVGVDLGDAKAFTEILREALMRQDVDGFIGALRSLLGGIPHSLHLEAESYYHSILLIIGKLLGLVVQCEVETAEGSIDMVVQNKETIFVIEFKYKRSAAEAMAQIKHRRYYEHYMHDGKKIFLIGVAFNFADKRLIISHLSEVL